MQTSLSAKAGFFYSYTSIFFIFLEKHSVKWSIKARIVDVNCLLGEQIAFTFISPEFELPHSLIQMH